MFEVLIIYRCNDGNTGQHITILRALPFIESAKIEGKIGHDLVKVRAKIKKEWNLKEFKILLELLGLYVRCKEKLIALPQETVKTLKDCLKVVLEEMKEDVFDIDDLPENIKEAMVNIREIKLVDNSTPDDEYFLEPTSRK